MNPLCPELEALLAADLAGSGPELEHARTCPACSAVLAADRELSRSLERLRDPVPPDGFVAGVMARIEVQVSAARKMHLQILSVLGVAVAGFVSAFFIAGPTDVLTHAIHTLQDWMAVTTAARVVVEAARPLLSTFSVPLVAGQVVLAILLVLGLRRLTQTPTPVGEGSGSLEAAR